MKLTIKRAMIFYLVAVAVAVGLAWLMAYFVAWWAGMALLTLIVADHVRYTLKLIRRGA